MSFVRSPRRRFGAALFLFAVSVNCAEAAAAAEQAVPSEDGASHPERRRLDSCAAAALAPLPRTAVERRALLHRLESLRERCLDHPGFLAALGGSWLEEGNPVQALLWLERALMLDPHQLGARADHALALNALGERQALDELMREWRLRTDIPIQLVERLVTASIRPSDPLSAGQNDSGNGRWAQSRELMLLYGHESNLDRSPRLTELTITTLDGPIDVKVDQRPKPGGALAAEGSWQAAYSPAPGALVQAGLQAAARAAPANPATDWFNVQLAGAASRRISRVRIELQASVTSIGGQLNEPYRLGRWGLSLQSNGLGCTHRVSFDFESRRQSVTALANSRTRGGLWSTICPTGLAGGWSLGSALRASTDKPDDATRPGGVQRQWSAGLRAFGPAGQGQLEVGIRFTRALESDAYNQQFFGELRRRLEPVQLNIEYSRPVSLVGNGDSEFVVQALAAHQSSNLALFRYTAYTAFSGLRWRW